MTEGGEGSVGRITTEFTKDKMRKNRKNKCVFKDKTGKLLLLDASDKSIVEKNLVGQTKGMVSCKHKITGESLSVKLDDTRWISGELVGINSGRVVTKSQKQKVSDAMKGRIWIRNIILNETKMIDLEELGVYQHDGWERGRKI